MATTGPVAATAVVKEVESSPSTVCAGCRTLLKCVLAIVGVPIAAVLVFTIWLLRHITLVALIQLFIVVPLFINTAFRVDSTISSMTWQSTIWDILIISVFSCLTVMITEVKWPWSSSAHRISFTVMGAGILAFVITKWSAISHQSWFATDGANVMLITLAAGASFMIVSQWWILSSRHHLQESQDRVMALELADHFATPADRRAFTIGEHTHAGVSYYLVDELPLRHSSPPSPTILDENKDGSPSGNDPSSISLSFDATPKLSPSSVAGGVDVVYGSFDQALSSPSVSSAKPFLVVLHGYMGGKAIFVPCFGSLAKQFRLVVADVPGMGLCDRPSFDGRSTTDAELFFSTWLEKFRLALMEHHQLASTTKIWLLGHSYGGYIAADYALRYPDVVAQLILASPVGLPAPPPATGGISSNSARRLGIAGPLLMVLWDRHLITPQAVLRFLGPIGLKLVRRAVEWRFEGLPMHRRALADYLYHLNVSPDSGNSTFTYILGPGVFARQPLRDRLLDLKCPTHFVYGQHDWMDPIVGREVSQGLRHRGISSNHQICPNAGHQLFMENPTGFYQIMLQMTGLKVATNETNEDDKSS